MIQERASYTVLLEHEGKEWPQRDNKVGVFNRGGDAIDNHSTHSLGNAVKDACRGILNDALIGQK